MVGERGRGGGRRKRRGGGDERKKGEKGEKVAGPGAEEGAGWFGLAGRPHFQRLPQTPADMGGSRGCAEAAGSLLSSAAAVNDPIASFFSHFSY